MKKPAFKWWTYQRERFPVLKNGLLIAVFSSASVSYSHLVRGDVGPPRWPSLLVAFVAVFLFFLQLRIADEFKDFEDDRRYRPYRPVSRGLITLGELAWLGILSLALQLGFALWLHPPLVSLLLLVWIYLGLMSQEFFVSTWLKRYPILYMLSHMVIMPLINLYATACDWLVQSAPMPAIGWYLAASFLNGMVIEVGRKIRAPQDEELGVETYSVLWGIDRAILVWWSMIGLAGLFSVMAATPEEMRLVVIALVLVFCLGTGLLGLALSHQPTTQKATIIEAISGLWVLLLYFAIGIAPQLQTMF